MNQESVDCKFCKNHEEFDAYGDGALMVDDEVLSGDDNPAMFIYLMLPGNNDAGAIQVTRDPRRSLEKRVWLIKGDPKKIETLSLSPSINLQGEWHGYLRKGRLISC